MNTGVSRDEFKSKVSHFFLNDVDIEAKVTQIITLFDNAREVKVIQDLTTARVEKGIASYLDKQEIQHKDFIMGLTLQMSMKASPAAYAFHFENRKGLIEIQQSTSKSLNELAQAYKDACSNDNIKDSIFELILTNGENWYSVAQECQGKACATTNAPYDKIIKYSLPLAVALFVSAYYSSNSWLLAGCIISLLASVFAINERYYAII